MATINPDLAVLQHPDGAAHDTPTNAPRSRFHEESGQILADALRASEKDSAGEKALLLALDLLANREPAAPPPAAASGGNGDGLNRRYVTRLLGAAALFLSLVQPTTSSIADRYLSPTSEIVSKLDSAIAGQVQVAADQRELQAVVVSLVKWIADCELVRRSGGPMPEPPASVRLLLAQDELTRSTGP